MADKDFKEVIEDHKNASIKGFNKMLNTTVDFKKQNNYREVECCEFCKYFRISDTDWTYEYCAKDAGKEVRRGYICDKWEHE